MYLAFDIQTFDFWLFVWIRAIRAIRAIRVQIRMKFETWIHHFACPFFNRKEPRELFEQPSIVTLSLSNCL